jgi:hypothetical protein
MISGCEIRDACAGAPQGTFKLGWPTREIISFIVIVSGGTGEYPSYICSGEK